MGRTSAPRRLVLSVVLLVTASVAVLLATNSVTAAGPRLPAAIDLPQPAAPEKHASSPPVVGKVAASPPPLTVVPPERPVQRLAGSGARGTNRDSAGDGTDHGSCFGPSAVNPGSCDRGSSSSPQPSAATDIR